MVLFNERHLHSIDQKGRLQLPRDVRRALKLKRGDVLHLLPTGGERRHLEIRTHAQWNDYREKFLAEAPGAQKRDFMRFVELSKEEAAVDGQGRIGVPKRLREMCLLEGQVAIIDLPFCIEVWNTNFVQERYSEFERAFKDFNDRLL